MLPLEALSGEDLTTPLHRGAFSARAETVRRRFPHRSRALLRPSAGDMPRAVRGMPDSRKTAASSCVLIRLSCHRVILMPTSNSGPEGSEERRRPEGTHLLPNSLETFPYQVLTVF